MSPVQALGSFHPHLPTLVSTLLAFHAHTQLFCPLTLSFPRPRWTAPPAVRFLNIWSDAV